MNSNHFIIKSLLVIISHLVTINGDENTGLTSLACIDKDKFVVSNENPSKLGKYTTVIFELLQGNEVKKCVELDQGYKRKISMVACMRHVQYILLMQYM